MRAVERRRLWRRVVLVVALAAVVLALLRSPAVYGALLSALAAVQRVALRHEGIAAALVVLVAAGAAMLAFFSSWLVVPFAVYTWGPVQALVLVLAGWVLGGAAAYGLARKIGRPVARWLGVEPMLARYEEQVSHRTPFPLALLLLLALPAEVRGLLFGLGRYAFGRYVVGLALADLPLAVVTVYAGAAVVTRRPALLAGAAAGFALLTGWAWFALQRRMHGGGRPGVAVTVE